jgi:hypothetical protein
MIVSPSVTHERAGHQTDQSIAASPSFDEDYIQRKVWQL